VGKGKEIGKEMEMTSPITRTRLWIEHAKASPERRAEIESEMLAQFGIAFRALSKDVGVWEPVKKEKKK
jgi:hypothetical protein